MLHDSSKRLFVEHVPNLLSEFRAAIVDGWLPRLCENLEIELNDIYEVVASSFQCLTNTQDKSTREQLQDWAAAYPNSLVHSLTTLTSRDKLVLINVTMLRMGNVYLKANPKLEPAVLDLKTVAPQWSEVLDNVQPSPFKLGNFAAFHKTFFADTEKFKEVVKGFQLGFRLGYHGVRNERWGRSPEPEDPDMKERILNILRKEINHGRVIGPLPDQKPSFLDFLVVSPIHLIPKRSNGVPIPDKYRLIHNLSWGRLFRTSVNDGIDVSEFETVYIKFDEICEDARTAGVGSSGIKSDQVDAFRQVPVAEEDIPLLGISYMGNLYVDTRLVFGVRSGPSIFSDISRLFRNIYQEIIQGTRFKNMQDDFFNFEAAIDAIASAAVLVGFKDFMEIVGFELSAEKTVTPCTKIIILGLEIDTVLQTVSIPPARMEALKTILHEWLALETATKVQMQSLIGVLQFTSYGVRWGRTFTRRLIDTMKTLTFQTDSVDLDAGTKADIEWWVKFAESFSGVSFIIDPQPIKVDLHLYSDASNPCCAGVWVDSWWRHMFTEEELLLLGDISCKELFAVVTQCATFGRQLQGKTILLFCDNSASVEAVNSLAVHSPTMMKLVRELFYLCATYSIQVKARHLPGVKNCVADCLSRPEKFHEAWQYRPTLVRQGTKPILPTMQW